MAECCQCGGWIETGINDVHGYCHRCEEHVGNAGRMHLCEDDDCPMCAVSGLRIKVEVCPDCHGPRNDQEGRLCLNACSMCNGTGLISRRSYRARN